MKRAISIKEIRPLAELCREGKLFEVQQWIEDGKPIDPPLKRNSYFFSPLEEALNSGFHSLVKVLLYAGASVEKLNKHVLEHIVELGRKDLFGLLVEGGFQLKTVDMIMVLETCDDEKTIDFLVKNGGDLWSKSPLQEALYTPYPLALKVFKKNKKKFPDFNIQVNSALRYHCMQGNHETVELMLKAGADPYDYGSEDPFENTRYQLEANAFEVAILNDQLGLLESLLHRLEPKRPENIKIKETVLRFGKIDSVKLLVESGVELLDIPGRNEIIQNIIFQMDSDVPDRWEKRKKKNIDSKWSREKIQLLHYLVRYGFRWSPKDKAEIASARRSFLNLKVEYICEFIWIMAGYKACSREDIEELVRTPTMQKLIADEKGRIEQMLNNF